LRLVGRDGLYLRTVRVNRFAGADEFAAAAIKRCPGGFFRRTLRVFCTRRPGSPCSSSTVTLEAGLIFPLASVSARICSTRSRA